MTLPRHARMTLGALGMALLGGILGLAWWSWRHRPGYQPVARFRGVRAGVVAAGLVIIAVGAVWRTTAAIRSLPACSPPGGALAATRSGPFDVSLLAQKAATWPETGIGLLYARVGDAHVCWSRSANYYVAVHEDNIAGARAMTMGDIVLTPGFNYSREQLRTLAVHEARHRVQWAVGDVIGGPTGSHRHGQARTGRVAQCRGHSGRVMGADHQVRRAGGEHGRCGLVVAILSRLQHLPAMARPAWDSAFKDMRTPCLRWRFRCRQVRCRRMASGSWKTMLPVRRCAVVVCRARFLPGQPGCGTLPRYSRGSSRKWVRRADVSSGLARKLGECAPIAAGGGSTGPAGSSQPASGSWRSACG